MTHISIVTSAYNAESCLPELYKRLIASLTPITADFEIIIVEDGSEDRTWETILKLSKQDPRVKGFRLSRNFGQHNSITAALDQCEGDWVVVMDCDMQDQPEDIPQLYQKALQGYDIVHAKRMRRGDPVIKKAVSWFFYKVFSWLSGMKYDGQVGNFRMISKKVALSCRELREQVRFFGATVYWVGYRSASIEVEHPKALHRKSSYNFRKLWKLGIDIIIAHSDVPLKTAITIGFIMSMFAFGYGGWLVIRYMLWGSIVTGWTSLITSLYFIGGLIIFILGILGTYLGKVFNETKKRPLYIIRESTINEFARVSE